MSSSPPTAPARILSFEEARRLVEQHAASLASPEKEVVNLLAGRGRVLAEKITADRDFPPFPRSTRDGYAVRAEDLQHLPVRLEVVGEVKAGDSTACSVSRGQAVSIMTGAPLPPGADAVVMVEDTSVLSDCAVEVRRNVAAGENFVPRAAEARAGETLLDQGRRLDHAGIAIAASVGKSRVEVFRRPRVAVLATGDELVEIDATPGPAQIRNSNSYSLAAQVENAGAEGVPMPIAPDEPKRLRALIEQAFSETDLLLLTGGVSMGKYDLVEQVLEDLKAQFYFTGARIQPGRPIVFGSCPSSSCGAGAPARVQAPNRESVRARISAAPKKYFFGLPGNPVSTMVTFDLFVRPMIEALAGASPQPLVFLRAQLKSDVRTKTGLKRFLPAFLSGEFENATVELARWQGSGDIATLARANCLVVITPDRERIEAGEWVPVIMR